jgi:lysophospholipase
MKKLGLVLWLASSFAFGLSEAELEKDYSRLVTPLFSLGTPGTIIGAKGVGLRYRAFPRSEGKGVIVIVPGFSESFLKFPELIYDLWNAGYGVYLMDHRGMGMSGRTLANPQLVHVEKFEHYVTDLGQFIDEVVLRDPMASKLYLYAHSTGGLIGAHFLAKRPQLFRAAILSAPLLDMDTGKYSRIAAVALANTLLFAGYGEAYAPGYADLDLSTFTLENSATTQSAVRFNIYKETLQSVPQIQMGGPTVWWAKQVLDLTEVNRVEALGGLIRTPMLMLQPSNDSLVKPRGQNRFCGAAWDCRKLVVLGAKHELYREKDIYREPSLKASLEFFESHK